MRFLTVLSALFALLATSFATGESRVVLGRVGQVLEPAKVHTRASSRSSIYFRVKPNDILVVNANAPKGWAKVLLNTGGYGYIPVESVEILAYEVTSAAPARNTPLMASRGSNSARGAAAEKGLEFQGTPYEWGGNDIRNGIDCSGFVQKLYGAIGINLPRTAAQQAMVGTPVTDYEDLRKGDRLYFWDFKRNKIGHTGLYLGNWQFVHSSSSRGGVAVDDIRNRKWLSILVAARR
jgi:cell wall-associated NlpC family hydrolase